MKIKVESFVVAPIETVWELYTTPAHIVNWNAASDDWHATEASVDLRAGGEFSSRMEAKDGSFGFDFAGVYTEIIEPTYIAYSFGERSAQIQFTNMPNGVMVSIEFDSESTNPIEQQQEGWQAILDRFARYVENALSARA
jgi:uncharacterized protein YndB with AHSA1/START domain